MSRQRLNCVLNFGTNLLLLVWPPTVLIIFINLHPVPVVTAQSQILLVQMKYYFYVVVFLVLSNSAIIIYLVKVKCNDNVRIMDLCHHHGRPILLPATEAGLVQVVPARGLQTLLVWSSQVITKQLQHLHAYSCRYLHWSRCVLELETSLREVWICIITETFALVTQCTVEQRLY